MPKWLQDGLVWLWDLVMHSPPKTAKTAKERELDDIGDMASELEARGRARREELRKVHANRGKR